MTGGGGTHASPAAVRDSIGGVSKSGPVDQMDPAAPNGRPARMGGCGGGPAAPVGDDGRTKASAELAWLAYMPPTPITPKLEAGKDAVDPDLQRRGLGGLDVLEVASPAAVRCARGG
jgi:hypothetical protein